MSACANCHHPWNPRAQHFDWCVYGQRQAAKKRHPSSTPPVLQLVDVHCPAHPLMDRFECPACEALSEEARGA